MKKTHLCKVLSLTHINEQVFTLTLEKPAAMEPIGPSQFFNLKSHEYPYLRRPISISRFDDNTFDFTIIIKGEGTERMAKLRPGDMMDVQGPLGNTYDIDPTWSRVLVVGGGIGVPPQSVLAEALKERSNGQMTIHVCLGFKDKPYLLERFSDTAAQLKVASEAGYGDYKGYVTDLVTQALEEASYDQVFVCGPHILIEKVAKIAMEKGVEAQLLMEERMACGIGACMVCTCKIKDETRPEGYWNQRVCKDGPVFKASEVLFDA